MGAARPRRKWKWLLLVAALAVAAFGVWYFAIRTPEPRDDPGRFQGNWQLSVPAFDREGKLAARRVPGVMIRIAGDRAVWTVGDQEQKRYAITLRPEANPKEIDLTQLAPNDQPLMQQWPPPARPVTLRGIYTVADGQAKIVMSIGDEDRPTSLDATDGVTVWLLVKLE